MRQSLKITSYCETVSKSHWQTLAIGWNGKRFLPNHLLFDETKDGGLYVTRPGGMCTSAYVTLGSQATPAVGVILNCVLYSRWMSKCGSDVNDRTGAKPWHVFYVRLPGRLFTNTFVIQGNKTVLTLFYWHSFH